MTELTLSGIGLVYSLLAISVGMIALIFGIRIWYKSVAIKKQNEKQQGQNLPKGLKSRIKYKELDVFSLSRPIWMFSLGIALMICLSAFSWVSTTEEVNIPVGALEMDDEFDVKRTAPPKPKPPPPPPPPPPIDIQEVEEILEDEPVFESNDIDAYTEIVEFEPEVDDTPAPAPPPPPAPVIVEEMDYVVAEVMPRFPGCEDMDGTKEEKKKCAEEKMLQYVYANTNYPSIARENGIEGRAILQFVVDKTGKITKAKIVRNIAGGCGEEGLRVVNGMPDWIPGKQRGRAVNVLYTLPVVFQLEN